MIHQRNRANSSDLKQKFEDFLLEKRYQESYSIILIHSSLRRWIDRMDEDNFRRGGIGTQDPRRRFISEGSDDNLSEFADELIRGRTSSIEENDDLIRFSNKEKRGIPQNDPILLISQSMTIEMPQESAKEEKKSDNFEKNIPIMAEAEVGSSDWDSVDEFLSSLKVRSPSKTVGSRQSSFIHSQTVPEIVDSGAPVEDDDAEFLASLAKSAAKSGNFSLSDINAKNSSSEGENDL